MLLLKSRHAIFRSRIIIFFFLAFVLSINPVGAEERLKERDSDSDVGANRATGRRVVVFDNWSVEVLFGRGRHRQREEERQATEKNSIPENASSIDLSLRPNQPFTARITPGTPSRRAAALRIAEKGRQSLQVGEYERGLLSLEKALALDPSPYLYYYLARAHHHLTDYQGSLNFLNVAEPWLSTSPQWMSELAALRQQNVRALNGLRQVEQRRAVQEKAEVAARKTASVKVSLFFSFQLLMFGCLLFVVAVLSGRFKQAFLS